MAYNLNRIYSGLFIILSLITFYLLKADLILLIALSIFIIYEVIKNRLFNYNFSLLLIFIFLIFYLTGFFGIGNFLTLIIILFIIFLSVYFHKLFIFFNIILLFFLISSYEILGINRDFFYLIILASFINDTSAYIFGNLFKGPRIIPKISPNKTWSGTLSSLLISFCLMYFLFNFSIFISFLSSILFFLGDIYFSFIKRKNNIKDFSNIIPGHGGLLDRIDSFLFPIILVNLSI